MLVGCLIPCFHRVSFVRWRTLASGCRLSNADTGNAVGHLNYECRTQIITETLQSYAKNYPDIAWSAPGMRAADDALGAAARQKSYLLALTFL